MTQDACDFSFSMQYNGSKIVILYNRESDHPLMNPKNLNDKPVLHVQPETLDFGKYHPDDPLTHQPAIQVLVTNNGTGTLSGRLVPAVSWVIPYPIAFSCPAGETSQHTVKISTGAPQGADRKIYTFEEILLITSNAGEYWYPGSYVLSGRSTAPVSRSWTWLIIPVLLLGIAALILVFALRPSLTRQNAEDLAGVQAEMIFTQAAKTLFVEMTTTHQAVEAASFTHTTLQAGQENALPQQTSEFAPTSTFTPLPRQAFPNPEQFIRDYYQAVNDGDYAQSWKMLSTEFQETCCQVAGNDPFVIYTHFWDSVEKVEVVSSYLQDWDANPAILYVTLHYQHSRGDSFDEFHIFNVIADPAGKNLLIDQVQ